MNTILSSLNLSTLHYYVVLLLFIVGTVTTIVSIIKNTREPNKKLKRAILERDFLALVIFIYFISLSISNIIYNEQIKINLAGYLPLSMCVVLFLSCSSSEDNETVSANTEIADESIVGLEQSQQLTAAVIQDFADKISQL